MLDDLLTGHEGPFAFRLFICLLCGFLIGIERESRHKPAGISTHCFVMAGAMMFTYVSMAVDPNSPARIASQVVSGVGFLGAGMIIKGEGAAVRNLTTAAAIWFAAAVGMSIASGWYLIAGLCTAYAVLVPRIPHLKTWTQEDAQSE